MTFYSVSAKGGVLALHHRRLGEIALTPTIRDQFAGRRRPIASVSFARDETGAVTSLFMSSGPRVKNLRFEKVEAGIP